MLDQEAPAETQEDKIPQAEGQPAPDQETTATPEPADKPAPDADEKPKKFFTQEELDAAIGKRLAREQRKWEREQAARQVENQPSKAVPSGEIKQDDFETPEDYAQALADKLAEQKLAEKLRQEEHAKTLEAYQDREDQAREKYDDFDKVVGNKDLTITQMMADAIRSSDVGPEVAYWLGSNPKEAERISRLTPLLQVREIGKLEAKVASSPPPKKLTSAPEPINPVTSRAASVPVHDTTDPRSIKSMSTSEWIAAERQRQMRAWEARNR